MWPAGVLGIITLPVRHQVSLNPVLMWGTEGDERLRMQELYCAVELHGSLTRGMSTFDWNKTLEHKPNVTLVQKVNLRGFNAMMDASTD